MGTWGVGPFDNDCAADIIAGLTKPLHIVETRKSNTSAQYHYNEARVAAQFLVLAHGTDILQGLSGGVSMGGGLMGMAARLAAAVASCGRSRHPTMCPLVGAVCSRSSKV